MSLCSFVVLFFGRLYELRAVKAAGGLWSWWGRPAPGRPPSSNSFLSRGRGGALDTLKGETVVRFKAAVEGLRRFVEGARRAASPSGATCICAEVKLRFKSADRADCTMAFSGRESERGRGACRG
jgi:hypothetical protein